MNNSKTIIFAVLGIVVIAFIGILTVWMQTRRPPLRAHTINKSSGKLNLVPAKQKPPAESTVSITVDGKYRVIHANGIPDHLAGEFPNRGNPHRITKQRYVFRIPAHPKIVDRITPLGLQDFGIAVNGVPFDPGAAEWYLGDRNGGWQYEALSGAIPLGLDENHAHVQPTGAYHYHALPTFLKTVESLDPTTHSPLIGWAADGFPIYALYGYKNGNDPKSGITGLNSSYRLKSGKRPGGKRQPGGTYDGTFVADYEYVEQLGDLDECNGRVTVTPEFSKPSYAYFLTKSWPVIPRCYKGTPSKDFQRGRRRPPRSR